MLESKIVDYAIYLSPDAQMQSQIDTAIRALPQPYQPINYTMYDGLRRRFIAISIEIKTPDAPEEQAKMQLTVWFAAHMARLRDLSTMPSTIMSLPLLYVRGADWHVMFAEHKTEGVVFTSERVMCLC